VILLRGRRRGGSAGDSDCAWDCEGDWEWDRDREGDCESPFPFTVAIPFSVAGAVTVTFPNRRPCRLLCLAAHSRPLPALSPSPLESSSC